MVTGDYIRTFFWVSATLTLLFFIASVFIYHRSYKDPRWRIFDYNSRQASQSDIYNVSEILAIKDVRLVGNRTLRFEFTPQVETSTWEISTAEGEPVATGPDPEIQFPDEPSNRTYIFKPQGVSLHKEVAIQVAFYPKEGYIKSGLSWPDNYYSPQSSIPFSLKPVHSVHEWAGLPENDPERIEARRLLGDAVHPNAPTLEKMEQVFTFVMDRIKNAGGIPTDEVQAASPLKTYTMLCDGTGKGWCENVALAYYLFANAAGIPTRLVDVAGKFGPLKLTGHYFCESWVAEQSAWAYADPQSSIAFITRPDGRVLHTLDLKKIVDLNAESTFTARTYNKETGQLENRPPNDFYKGVADYLKDDIVLAYKFGYPANKSYSRLTHFLNYPTLLYAPFQLPNHYLIKQTCLIGFAAGLALTLLSGIGTFVLKF